MKLLHTSLSSVFAVLCVAACANGQASPPPEPRDDSSADASAPSTPSADASPERDSARAEDATTDATACASPCGLAPQCGCSATQTCDVSATDGARSCVGAGVAPAGRGCLGTFECARGLVCVSGVCREPCAAPGSACGGPSQGACREYPKSDADAGSVSVAACGVVCDYTNEGSCGFKPGDLAASGCVFREDTGTAECTKVRDVQLQSGVCERDAECGAGRVCIATSMGFRTCRRLCRPGDPNACGGCGPFPTPRVVAGVTFGYCP